MKNKLHDAFARAAYLVVPMGQADQGISIALRRSTSWRGFAVFVLLLAVAVLVRGRDFGNPVIHVDEEYYLLVGDRMLHGALPYVDIWDRKPIGLFLIYAAIRLLLGDGILVYQLAATRFAAATAWVIAQSERQLGAIRDHRQWGSYLSARRAGDPDQIYADYRGHVLWPRASLVSAPR